MNLNRTRQRLRTVRRAVRMFSTKGGEEGSLRKLVHKTLKVATTEGMSGIRDRVAVLASVPLPCPPPMRASNPLDAAAAYDQWRERFDSLREANIRAARAHLATLALPDLLILLVISRRDMASLPRLAAAWNSSIHPGWYAAIVPPADLDDVELDALRTLADANPRIAIVRDQTRLDQVRAGSPWTLLCFGGVLLNPLSAYLLLEAAERTGADVLYADHDALDASGRRVQPAFKPQFSPSYLSRFNYIGDCLLLSRAVSLAPVGIDELARLDVGGFDGLVRQSCAGRHVEHVPFILSHLLERRARHPVASPDHSDDGPGVVIVIPTRDGVSHLEPCVESILTKTTYDLEKVDIVIVDNGSTDEATLAWMDRIVGRPNVVVKRYPHPFNFAAINNLGVSGTRREVVVFLNDDTLVIDGAWLDKLVHYANQPGIGVVGAKLLFPDGTIQHGGCAAGDNMGTVSHLLMHVAADSVAATDHTREMSTVTGACFAVRRTVFEQIGGFDEVLKITWNDVKFCLDCLGAGYRNIYVADALLVHDESKTRGQENTPEKISRYFNEAHYTRRRFREVFRDDPSYNPNLPVSPEASFAEPPRVRRPWARSPANKRRVLVLSTVYAFGFGVSVVIQQQVRKLIEFGYDVVLGGPRRDNELPFPGCERVYLHAPREAAVYAWETDISLIVAHTPPYFEIPVFIGGHIPVLSYDYGEPPAALFPDPVRAYLLDVQKQKRSSAALASLNATISQAVKDETLNDDAVVLGLANSHLRSWSDDLRAQRDEVRSRRGWSDAFVVLTVCRFSANERQYKGLDKVADISREFPYIYPDAATNVVWALAGAGSPQDVAEVEGLGFTVFPNLPDHALAELYLAADAYLSFSRWEGYNLGIGQSLAMGLPTLASDIPAHREFPIRTTDSTLVACEWLAGEVVAGRNGSRKRRAVIFDWEQSATHFAEAVERLLRQTEKPALRTGAIRTSEPDACTTDRRQ